VPNTKENLKNVLKSVKEVTAEGDIVLFIDEIHTLVVQEWRRRYGCQYFETCLGSWRTARYCNHIRRIKIFEKTKHSKDVSRK
jgi:homospermidine synthase